MNDETYEDFLFKDLLSNYFKENDVVTNVQKESFEHFIHYRLQSIIEEEPCINVQLEKGGHLDVSFHQAYVDNPYIVDEKRQIRYITPNEARLRELTYSSTVSVDVIVREYVNNELKSEKILPKTCIARLPMMIGTSKCNLYDKSKEERFSVGECKYDTGGYFIIRGKERVLISQERGNLNHIYVFKQKPNVKYSHSAEIRSTSEENGHSVMVQMRLYSTNHRIMIALPFFQQEVPLSYIFVIFGYKSHHVRQMFDEIITTKHHHIEIFRSHLLRDMDMIATPENATKEIGQTIVHSIIKETRSHYISQVLHNDMFPHLGITSSVQEKVVFMIYMLHKLLQTFLDMRAEDDRDHMNNKRFETAGYLISELFRALYKRFVRMIEPQVQKKHDVLTIINRTAIITQGMKTCFATGNWGIPKSSYIRCGVSQILSRLSFNSTISHLRRILIPIGKEGKNSKIRQIHSSQYGFVCPNECFDPYTPILLWNGHTKLAKDIVVGDVLIDDNGNPSRVRKTISGRTQMYRIKVHRDNFLDHVVTWNHILTVRVMKYKCIRKFKDHTRCTWFDRKDLMFKSLSFTNHKEASQYMESIPNDDVIDMTIGKYLQLDDRVKKRLVIFKTNEIRWNRSEVDEDAYTIGYNVVHHKQAHIPHTCLVNDRHTRLQFLAGVMDACDDIVFKHNGIYMNDIAIHPSDSDFMKDMALLVRSLGFSFRSSSRHVVVESTKLHEIPMKRSLFMSKTIPKESTKLLESSFTIERCEEGAFVGWQVEGNGRFLLSDCTVVHNTPEGHSSGIVKNFTLFTRVSTRIESSHILNLLEDFFRGFFYKDFAFMSSHSIENRRRTTCWVHGRSRIFY
jgi:hypothetical protein